MPLTTRGISAQILGSIRTLRENHELCTTNDCKVVINNLIRKFSEPLDRDLKQRRLSSRSVAAGETDDTVEDHAVPVIVLIEQLFGLNNDQLAVTNENFQYVEKLLTDSLLLVEITRQEDATLSAKGFQRRMPKEWSDPGHPYFRDPLARYRAAGIEI